MKKIYIAACLLTLATFTFIVCPQSASWGAKNESTAFRSNIAQQKNEISLIDEAYNLIVNHYVEPVSPYDLIIEFVKGIEKKVGQTDLLYQTAGSYIVFSPTTNNPIPKTISNKKAITEIKDIYQFCVRMDKEKEPLPIAVEATKGMVSSLDPHCALLPPEAFKELQIGTHGEFTGIGVHVTMRNNLVTVISPIEGTPAYKAGIKAGDKIVKVDGEATDDQREAIKRLRGPKGTKVVITILREGEAAPLEFDLIRDVLPIYNVKHALLKPGYGYVWITNFRDNTSEDLLKALTEMESGETPLKGLVLDLRDNPGGILSQAIQISDIFLEEGEILSIKGRLKKYNKVFKAHMDETPRTYPLVVLINGASTSASEVVAGALQDHKRALIMGTTSFGKGSVQRVKTLRDGYGMKLTIARYYTPSGRSIQANGVKPDMIFKNKDPNEEKVLRKHKPLESIQDDYQVMQAVAIMESAKSGIVSNLIASARKQKEMKKKPSLIPHTPQTGISMSSARMSNAIAVVIGNQTYSHKDIPQAIYAGKDASAIKDFLVHNLNYMDANIIFEMNTTKAGLEKIFGTDSNHRGMLYNYIKPYKSDVFIYYSGHGSPDPTTNEAYLVPVDCDPIMMDLTAYPLNVLYNNLQKIEAKSATVVIDACFSGGTDTGKWLVPNASPILIEIKNPVTAQNNTTIFTSSEKNQVSSWYPEKQHSMFTYFFLKAITGSADFNLDRKITFQEIHRYVADRAEGVPYYAKRLHGGRIQTPTMHSSNKDAVLVEY